MRTSQNGINLIKSFEGCRLKAYKALKSENYFTIGYGHYGADVSENMVITQEQAEDTLKEDLKKFEGYVTQTGLLLNQNQFDALVSFTYNCGPGNLRKLVNGRSMNEIADAILQFCHAGGKELAGLKRRRNAERELFISGEKQIIIGSARIDENGNTTGGRKGDQKQTSQKDYSGEVSFQKFYIHKKGWIVISPKYRGDAQRISYWMRIACQNVNIGYNQADRLAIMTDGIDTTKPTSCDCSSLVRAVVKAALGIDPGNFTTATEAEALLKTGKFTKQEYTPDVQLLEGDILVTKTKGHTVIVTNDDVDHFGVIRKGDKTDAVKMVQLFLNTIGKYKHLDEDGDFGPKTEKVVKQFQLDKGLEVDGIVGPKTYKALGIMR